ncbi:MAG: Gfo/Idh/MocA family protein [Sphingobacteriaceae bacterium]
MKSVKWGIIGCGNVTEVKSGPAFNKVANSTLVAVMRRNAVKAEDYAKRHAVPKWYTNAQQLIDDPEVNAIYIATPPLYHEAYTLAALKAGKPVYVEKPMALTAAECLRMWRCAEKTGIKLTVAHYRRAQPAFNKLKVLLNDHAIGKVKFANLQMLQPNHSDMIAPSEENWRLDPAISGGGLFHDLAPHQVDLMLYYFGKIKKASGIAVNQEGLHAADDLVSGQILFESGVLFNGLWCFTAPAEETTDQCEIIGSEGKITFPVFGNRITVHKKGKEKVFDFERLPHVQQPMIEQVVKYFMDECPNPCPASEGAEVMRILDAFTLKA